MLPSLLAALKSPAKQNKLLLLSRNNTLISPSKQRISCSCCSDSAACSEQQEETKRKRSGRKAEVGARRSPILSCWSSCRSLAASRSSGAWGWSWSRCRDPSITLAWLPRAATALPASRLSPGPPAEPAQEGSVQHPNFWGVDGKILCTIHNHGSTRH